MCIDYETYLNSDIFKLFAKKTIAKYYFSKLYSW